MTKTRGSVVSGEWVESWLCLSGRQLIYSTEDCDSPFQQIHLKRTKDVFLKKDSKNLDLPTEFAKHPVLVCDFNDRYSCTKFGKRLLFCSSTFSKLFFDKNLYIYHI
jgi:hypothetical protein